MTPRRPISRRSVLAAVALPVLLPAGRAADAGKGVAAADRPTVHILNRLAFGPSLADRRHVEAIGVEAFVAEQLDPQKIPEPVELRWQLAPLDTLGLDPVRLRQLYGPLVAIAGIRPGPEAVREQQRRARIVVAQASAARIFRAVLSPRRLQEVLVDFWFNHFNIFAGTELEQIWIGDYEETIRRHALGSFRELLFAVAKHPAMLVYLDNTLNRAARGPKARGLNENYAREVMELHTLGANGGYTQEDVITLARVFTGWRVNPAGSGKFPGAAAIFDATRHDWEPKVFLGIRLTARGRAEGEEALDILARSPMTAHHIAFEIARHFVADAPPPLLTGRLTARFIETGGEIREVLKTLFASPEFAASFDEKYKTPYEFVISAVRAAGVPALDPRPLLAAMRRLGEPLYGCETPNGYADTEDAWLSPEASLQRVGFAAQLARGRLPISLPANDGLGDRPLGRQQPVDWAALEQVLGAGLSRRTRDAVARAPPGERAALILGSPDFMRL